MAAEFHAAARQDEEKHKKEELEQKLNDELGNYWNKGPVEEEDDDDVKTRADRKAVSYTHLRAHETDSYLV